jgi:hypothetical protein
MEPSVCGYNWTTLFLGDINMGTWHSRLEVGHKVDGLALQKKILLRNPKKSNSR